MSLTRTLVLAMLLLSLSGCGINDIPRYEEAVNEAWSQVLNQYQRRADLVPNLVATVKGAASHEKEVLTSVVEARAKVNTIKVTPEMLQDPAALKRFSDAQRELGSALSRLLATVEAYPDIKANQNFLAL